MTGFRSAAAAVALACAVLVLPAGAGAAYAQGEGGKDGAQQAATAADCHIFEIKASNEGNGVDPELKPLARKLKKPPFSSWKAFKLLKRHEKKVERMKALNLGLVTGSKLALLFRGASGGQPSKTRLRLTFTLDDKNGKRKLDGTINLDSGDYSLIGGDSIEGGGTYIVAVSCTVP
ncbi:MAG TPA: hypothetical protein VNO33_23165 [Kofleriaceae bacterium]|nr:hypothetical protein [Kofleriaceae bacterium]